MVDKNNIRIRKDLCKVGLTPIDDGSTMGDCHEDNKHEDDANDSKGEREQEV